MAGPQLPWTTGFEPKRSHKFVLELQNINVYFIKDVTIPKPTIGSEAKHTFLSHTFKFPGKLTWDDSMFTLVDPIDLNAADLFIRHLKDSGYVFPSSFDINDPSSATYYLKTIKKNFIGPNNQIQGMRIKTIDSNGSEIEAWTLQNSFVKNIDFGNFDYDADALKNIKVTVSCDWVDYQSFGLGGINTQTIG